MPEEASGGSSGLHESEVASVAELGFESDVVPVAFEAVGSALLLSVGEVSSLSGCSPPQSHFQPPGLETGCSLKK